jgi:hypothetical protein
MMFWFSFMFLVFYRLLNENSGFYMENAYFESPC